MNNRGKSVYDRKRHRKNFLVLLLLLFCVFLLTIVSLFVGQAKVSFADTLAAFFGKGSDVNVRVVWYVRMPRILAAIVVGFGLAIAGQVMQTTLQNPLASPSSLGVSSAATFGANLAIVLGAGSFAGNASTVLNVHNPYVVAVAAFAFALLAVFAVVLISKIRGFSPVTVILLGVAATSLFGALTTLVQYVASDQVLASAVYWSFGDLSRASYLKIVVMAACVFPSFLVFFLLRWKYNAVANGDDVARSLGVRLSVVRVVSLVLSSLITAVCVSFVGIIGFVGIVCPQLMKRFVGADVRYLLPASGLAGASLLLLSDMVARLIVPGMNLPVGAVTAIIGTPVFVYILLRREK